MSNVRNGPADHNAHRLLQAHLRPLVERQVPNVHHPPPPVRLDNHQSTGGIVERRHDIFPTGHSYGFHHPANTDNYRASPSFAVFGRLRAFGAVPSGGPHCGHASCAMLFCMGAMGGAWEGKLFRHCGTVLGQGTRVKAWYLTIGLLYAACEFRSTGLPCKRTKTACLARSSPALASPARVTRG